MLNEPPENNYTTEEFEIIRSQYKEKYGRPMNFIERRLK